MAISTQYGNSPDRFGHADYEAARRSGKSDQEILAFLNQQPGVLAGNNSRGAGGLYDEIASRVSQSSQPRESSPPPQPAAPPPKYSTGAGASSDLFGHADYQAALNSGASDQEILDFLNQRKDLLGGNNRPGGGGLYDEIQGRVSAKSYERSFQDTLKRYQDQLYEAQKERDSAKATAEDAKAKAAEYEAQQKAEREMAVSEQLSSLRTGSTVSGSAGPGLGSLSAGRSSYSVSTGGKQGGVLDRAYKDIDPTDSVLNKDVAIEAAGGSGGGSGGGSRTEARRRALTAGGNASSYYSRRFG